MLGELVNRTFFPLPADLDDAAIAGNESAAEASTTSAQSAGESQAARAGGVATVAKPTVAEMRARAAQNRPKLDARGLAMQATAAKIKPLSNFIYRTMQVGVLLIAAGTILGGVWADYSWGRFWGWDPKEVWALITLLVYLIPLHGRFAGWVNTFGLVIASIVCFMSVVMAWYGVNFVLGVGLHSYGFTEGGGQGIVSVVVPGRDRLRRRRRLATVGGLTRAGSGRLSRPEESLRTPQRSRRFARKRRDRSVLPARHYDPSTRPSLATPPSPTGISPSPRAKSATASANSAGWVMSQSWLPSDQAIRLPGIAAWNLSAHVGGNVWSRRPQAISVGAVIRGATSSGSVSAARWKA